MMNTHLVDHSRESIGFESTLLMAGLVVMLSLIASFVFGTAGLVFGPLSLALFYLVEAKAPISWMLRAHRAQPLPPGHPASRIFDAIRQRAGLQQDVFLYYSPANTFNAYTIGHSQEAVVVLTQPILDHFTHDEIAGILAHELSHVVNRDTRFMAMAASLAAMISQMSLIVLIFCFITLPLAFAQGHLLVYITMAAVALVIPTIALFLQARLSRTREFAADLGATELLGEPGYLISALLKLERYSSAFLFPWMRRGQGYFGSHPNTLARVQRLKGYGGRS